MNSFDRAINNDLLVISKSLVPYLRTDCQKPVAVFIKAFELMYTIDLFSNEGFVRSLSRSSDNEEWEKSFLQDLKQNLSPDRGYFIDALLKLTEVKDLLGSDASRLTPMPSDSDAPIDLSYKNFASPEPFDASYTAANPVSESAPSPPPGNSPNPAEVIDKISSFLEPNQVQLLKVLSSFLK